MQLLMYNNKKYSKQQNLTLLQNIVKLNSSTKIQLYLKIPTKKENIFVLLALYDFIFQIEKWKFSYFFWNTLSKTLFTNTGLAVNTLLRIRPAIIIITIYIHMHALKQTYFCYEYLKIGHKLLGHL